MNLGTVAIAIAIVAPGRIKGIPFGRDGPEEREKVPSIQNSNEVAIFQGPTRTISKVDNSSSLAYNIASQIDR
jgi:hypothetical protein